MRPHLLFAVIPVAIALASGGRTAAAEEAAKPQSYTAVPIELPQPVADATFHTFRKLIIDIAKRRDSKALAKHVAKSFFSMAGDKNVADPKRSGADNLINSLGLDAPDSDGWDSLATFASEPSADPDPQRKGVICSPGDPKVEIEAAEALAKLTGTSLQFWYYPTAPGLEVRGSRSSDSPVIAKLGLHLIWVYPDDSPAAAVQTDIVRIVTPSGQFGFVAADALVPLIVDLLCYIKEGNDWRIAGIMGSELPETK